MLTQFLLDKEPYRALVTSLLQPTIFYGETTILRLVTVQLISITVNFSNVNGSWADDFQGNINGNPLFVDAPNGNYRLWQVCDGDLLFAPA